ncbi:MAG: regulatory protein GemA [Zoogloeaceae bacterium]|jgi:phage gp16-like protein|nr:regulatory protein GemA [Zoogloeaceae bacterium]
MSFQNIPPAKALARLRGGIRAECAKQGIDDDIRKAMLSRIAGVGSSKDLTLKDAHRVLDHLRQTGRGMGKPAKDKKIGADWKFVFSVTPSRQPLLKKIYRLAETLGQAQTPPVPVASKAYVEGIAVQMVGATTLLEFCDTDLLHTIVQALEVHIRRNKLRGAAVLAKMKAGG